MRFIYSITVLILVLGCNHGSQLKLNTAKKQKQYEISMSNYAIDGNKIYIRLADKNRVLPLLIRGGYRFQIYIVAEINEKKEIKKVLSTYFISVNTWDRGGLNQGELKINKIILSQKNNKLFITLEAKGKGYYSTYFDLSIKENLLKNVSLLNLRNMDIEYDKDCILNKNFSIYSGDDSFDKSCK